MLKIQHSKYFIALATLVVFLTGCSTVVNPVSGKKEYTVMDENREIDEGRKSHEAVMAEYGVLKDARVQAYVNGIGQKLAAQSHRNNLKWTFTVLDSPEINAFALPGGYVYITRGIMAYLDSEADLAGVIGHEIGHVTARHGSQRATRQAWAGAGAILGSLAGIALESVYGIKGAGELAGNLSQTAAAGYVATYGREQELQADGLGAEYLSRSHYNPQNMVDVIEVLKNQERFAAERAKAQGKEPRSGNSWLASHPSSDERLSQITQLASQYKGTQGYQDDGRTRYQNIVSGLTFGESPEQGLTRGRNFYHPTTGFALTVPEGWQIINEADSLNILSPQSDALLTLNVIPKEVGANHEEIIRRAIAPTSGNLQRLNLNGLNATHFVGSKQSRQGTQRIDTTIFTAPNQQVFAFTKGFKDASAASRTQNGMQTIIASVRPMSQSDQQQARPWNIRVVPMPTGGFAELAKSSPIEFAEQQLRLLNGVYEKSTVIPAGSPVKIVVTK